MFKLHEGNLEQELMSEEEFDNMIESLLISKKNIKKFSKKKLIDGEGLESEELKMEDNMFLENINEENIFMEGAKFGTWFKGYPELERNKSLIRNAEDILKSNSEDAGTKGNKIARTICNILGTFDNIMLPISFLSFPIGPLLNRFEKYLFDLGNFGAAKSETQKVISALNRVKSRNSKNKELCKKIDKMIDELEENLRELREDSTEMEGNLFLNESNIFLD